ncbi:MAG TPA: helix-turn-helix domain-containing protein [Chthoniobacterales bacterium]|jgi:AraC-like DNA-binding protein
MLFHRVRSVSPLLSRWVEHLWVARGVLDSPWRNMILPDGAVEVIINLGDPQKLCDPDDHARFTSFRHSWISGERTAPIVIEEDGYVHLVGVRLRAGGAWPLLGLPLSEFTGRVVDMDAVLGREIDRLREDLGEAFDDDRRFTLVEEWLLRRIRGRVQPPRAVQYALEVIQRGDEALRIGRIADEIGLSHKHLLREFDRCVGLRPKTFARLCSFQRAIDWIGHKPSVDWADAALVCGYYDQAHFIHEFRSFSGLTPESYLSKRGPFLNYLAVSN